MCNMLLQDAINRCLKALLNLKDISYALPIVRDVLTNLERDSQKPPRQYTREFLDKYIATYSIKSCYKGEQELLQKALWKKLQHRLGPTFAPKAGDRLEALIIYTRPNTLPAYQKVEDPSYIMAHHLRLDFETYLNKLKSSLVRIFSTCGYDVTSLFEQCRRVLQCNSQSCNSLVMGPINNNGKNDDNHTGEFYDEFLLPKNKATPQQTLPAPRTRKTVSKVSPSTTLSHWTGTRSPKTSKRAQKALF